MKKPNWFKKLEKSYVFRAREDYLEEEGFTQIEEQEELSEEDWFLSS